MAEPLGRERSVLFAWFVGGILASGVFVVVAAFSFSVGVIHSETLVRFVMEIRHAANVGIELVFLFLAAAASLTCLVIYLRNLTKNISNKSLTATLAVAILLQGIALLFALLPNIHGVVTRVPQHH